MLDAETLVIGEVGAGVYVTLQLGKGRGGELGRGSVRQVVMAGQGRGIRVALT